MAKLEKEKKFYSRPVKAFMWFDKKYMMPIFKVKSGQEDEDDKEGGEYKPPGQDNFRIQDTIDENIYTNISWKNADIDEDDQFYKK